MNYFFAFEFHPRHFLILYPDMKHWNVADPFFHMHTNQSNLTLAVMYHLTSKAH